MRSGSGALSTWGTNLIAFRDGSCAIGMFRAITEINVLVQLRADPLIAQ